MFPFIELALKFTLESVFDKIAAKRQQLHLRSNAHFYIERTNQEIFVNNPQEIESKFNQIKKEQPISPDMESVFMEKTNSILNPIFQKYLIRH